MLDKCLCTFIQFLLKNIQKIISLSILTEHKKQMRPKDSRKAPVKTQVKQTVRHPAKTRGYEEGVKQCPGLMSMHRIYIQTRKERRLHLTVGGHAYLLPNTTVVIKCPVRRFPKAYIRWLKDGSTLPSSQHLGVTKSGSLKIQFLEPEDSGMYKCVAGPASDIFTLQLIGSGSRSAGRSSADSPSPSWEEMLPNCYSHDSFLEGIHPEASVSLVPPGDRETSLQPRVEERVINITLQADRGEIQQEQASELISTLLTHLPPAQLWTRTTRRGGQGNQQQEFLNSLKSFLSSTTFYLSFNQRQNEFQMSHRLQTSSINYHNNPVLV